MRKGDDEGIEATRQEVDAAKRKLGERADVWWQDSAPDFNRKLVKNKPYAERVTKLKDAQQDILGELPGYSGSPMYLFIRLLLNTLYR